MGYHNVFDHYRAVLRRPGREQDGLHFHYHPHSFRKEAHRCATHWWASSDSLYQILSRRVIDRQWFPAANRPGFHVIRPDSHWFLEQYIPFDFSSQAMLPADDDAAQAGLEGGRLGRLAPCPRHVGSPTIRRTTTTRCPGACRRWIARCLNVGTRYRLLAERDVRQAFQEAQRGQAGRAGRHQPRLPRHAPRHRRGARPARRAVAADFPDVPFRFCEAVAGDAGRAAAAVRAAPASWT